MQGNTYKPKMETSITKKKHTDIFLHLLKKVELLNMNVGQSVPVDQIPDISTSLVSNFWGQMQTYLPRNILSGEEQGKTAVFVGFVKHAKEPPNANAREAPVKSCVI